MEKSPRDIGDQGQRYAIQVYVKEEEEMADGKWWDPGWHNASYTNRLQTAEIFAQAFLKRPNWSRTRVIDRMNENAVAIKYPQKNRRPRESPIKDAVSAPDHSC